MRTPEGLGVQRGAQIKMSFRHSTPTRLVRKGIHDFELDTKIVGREEHDSNTCWIKSRNQDKDDACIPFGNLAFYYPLAFYEPFDNV